MDAVTRYRRLEFFTSFRFSRSLFLRSIGACIVKWLWKLDIFENRCYEFLEKISLTRALNLMTRGGDKKVKILIFKWHSERKCFFFYLIMFLRKGAVQYSNFVVNIERTRLKNIYKVRGEGGWFNKFPIIILIFSLPENYPSLPASWMIQDRYFMKKSRNESKEFHALFLSQKPPACVWY